jgi:hypothetical protein
LPYLLWSTFPSSGFILQSSLSLARAMRSWVPRFKRHCLETTCCLTAEVRWFSFITILDTQSNMQKSITMTLSYWSTRTPRLIFILMLKDIL